MKGKYVTKCRDEARQGSVAEAKKLRTASLEFNCGAWSSESLDANYFTRETTDQLT